MREMLAGTFFLRSTLLGELSTPEHTTGVGEGALRPQEEGQVLTSGAWSGAHILADFVCLGTGKEQIPSCWVGLENFLHN